MFKGTNWPSEHIEYLKDEYGADVVKSKMCKCIEKTMSTNCVSNLCKECCTKQNKDLLFCPRHQLRRPLKAKRNIKFSTKLKMLPPWLKFPSYPRYDIGWRMGDGEDYWWTFWGKYRKLFPKEQKWYQQDFPEPKEWDGVYMDMTEISETDES